MVKWLNELNVEMKELLCSEFLNTPFTLNLEGPSTFALPGIVRLSD